jgi:hypothetical protein
MDAAPGSAAENHAQVCQEVNPWLTRNRSGAGPSLAQANQGSASEVRDGVSFCKKTPHHSHIEPPALGALEWTPAHRNTLQQQPRQMHMRMLTL